jgi:hypothetical protein
MRDLTAPALSDEATRKREYRNVRRMPSRPLTVVTGSEENPGAIRGTETDPM